MRDITENEIIPKRGKFDENLLDHKYVEPTAPNIIATQMAEGSEMENRGDTAYSNKRLIVSIAPKMKIASSSKQNLLFFSIDQWYYQKSHNKDN